VLRSHPPGSLMLVADRDLHIVRDTTSVRELQHVHAVHVHRIGTDQLQLSVDLDARLLAQLSACTFFRKFTSFDRSARQEPLPSESRALGTFQEQDLVVALDVDDSSQCVHWVGRILRRRRSPPDGHSSARP